MYLTRADNEWVGVSGEKDKGVSERGGGADTDARGEIGGAERGDSVGARGRGGAGEG